MKNCSLVLFLALITGTVIGQVPQGIPYQAVARDAQGQPLASRAVKVRFSVLDSTATGAAVYVETHATNTNALGLFALNVGMGTPVTGTFSGINWGVNSKFLKVELDTTASGNNYVDLGTQQMMSVPYALCAGNSVSAAGIISNPKFSRIITLSGSANDYTLISVVPTGKLWRISYNSGGICPLYNGLGSQMYGKWWLNSGDSVFYRSNDGGTSYMCTIEEFDTLTTDFTVRNFKVYDRNSSPVNFTVPLGKYWEIVSISSGEIALSVNGILKKIIPSYYSSIPPFLIGLDPIFLDEGSSVQIPFWAGGYLSVLEYSK